MILRNYYLGLTHDIKKVGEFEFITGIDFNIPAKYKDMFKFEL